MKKLKMFIAIMQNNLHMIKNLSFKNIITLSVDWKWIIKDVYY